VATAWTSGCEAPDITGARRWRRGRGRHFRGVLVVSVRMSRVVVPHPDAELHVQDAILDRVADGTVLVGTLGALARGLGVSASDLRSGLRGLVEGERVAVTTEPRGQLTIRLERRKLRVPPSFPPVAERRRLILDDWIL
jgi:hypothetical protein